MKVLDVISACEYVGCSVVNFWGEEIKITKENCSDIYDRAVEHISAKDNRVIIFTFDEIDNKKKIKEHEIK